MSFQLLQCASSIADLNCLLECVVLTHALAASDDSSNTANTVMQSVRPVLDNDGTYRAILLLSVRLKRNSQNYTD